MQFRQADPQGPMPRPRGPPGGGGGGAPLPPTGVNSAPLAMRRRPKPCGSVTSARNWWEALQPRPSPHLWGHGTPGWPCTASSATNDSRSGCHSLRAARHRGSLARGGAAPPPAAGAATKAYRAPWWCSMTGGVARCGEWRRGSRQLGVAPVPAQRGREMNEFGSPAVPRCPQR